MLEHLHRYAAIEVGGRKLQPIHVFDAHANIREPEAPALGLDELALRARVRDCVDPGSRVTLRHPERERSPAAAKLENVLAVAELCALGVSFKHVLLGLVEAFAAVLEVGARVLEPLAQAGLKECGRQLVVLRVRGIRMNGDRACAQRLDARLEPRGLLLGIAGELRGQSAPAEGADAETHERIGHEPALCPAQEARTGAVLDVLGLDGSGDRVHGHSRLEEGPVSAAGRGNQGNSSGVDCW